MGQWFADSADSRPHPLIDTTEVHRYTPPDIVLSTTQFKEV